MMRLVSSLLLVGALVSNGVDSYAVGDSRDVDSDVVGDRVNSKIYRDAGGSTGLNYWNDFTFTVRLNQRPPMRGDDGAFWNGVLLTPEWVLTLGSETKKYEHILGTRVWTSYRDVGHVVDYIVKFTSWDDYEYDFALLRLRDSIHNRETVPLFKGDLNELIQQRPDCMMTSYGTTHIENDRRYRGYRKLEVSLKPDSNCEKFTKTPTEFERDPHFCYKGIPDAEGQACKEDEGAPITCLVNGTRYLVGLNLLSTECDGRKKHLKAVGVGSDFNQDPVMKWIRETTRGKLGSPTTPDCPELPTVDNGEYVSWNNTSAFLMCHEGFTPSVPVAELVCTPMVCAGDSTQWAWSDHSEFSCKRKLPCEK